jgi:hypothetical protein
MSLLFRATLRAILPRSRSLLVRKLKNQLLNLCGVTFVSNV